MIIINQSPCFNQYIQFALKILLLPLLSKAHEVNSGNSPSRNLFKKQNHYKSFQHRSLYGNTNIDVDYPPHHPFYNTTTNTDDDSSKSINSYYEPIRILTETSQLEELLSLSSDVTEIDKIKINILLNDTLPNLTELYSKLLKVIPIRSPLNIMIYDSAICDNQVPLSSRLNYYNSNQTVDFLSFIHVDIDCMGYGTLAYSHPCQLDQFDRPVIGRMVFCLDSIELNDKTESVLFDTAVHEMGHLLGVHSQLMPYYRNGTTGAPLTERPFTLSNVTCVDGVTRDVIAPSDKVLQQGSIYNRTYYEIITPFVKTIAQNQFNCHDDTVLKGARLEMIASPSMNDDCFGSHFDERLYFTEVMSSIYNNGITFVSPLTLALLEDTGWYKADYSTVHNSIFGYGSGCDFITKDCIVNGTIPDYSNGAFCNTTISTTSSSTTSSIALDNSITDAIPTCDPTHYQVSLCDLIDHSKTKTIISSTTLSKQSNYFDNLDSSTITNTDQSYENYPQYFNNPNLGPMILKDALNCPIPHLTLYDCRYNTVKRKDFEIFGDNSRCFNVNNNAFCFEMSCNKEKSIDVNVNGVVYTCKEGMKEIIIFSEANMVLKCPSFRTLCSDLVCPANCSGRGKCNFNTYKCECFDPNDTSETCANSPWLGAASGVNNDIIGSTTNGGDATSSGNCNLCDNKKMLSWFIFWITIFVVIY